MLKIWMIRHGMTEGNRHGRYIGVTDEPLCGEGRTSLMQLAAGRFFPEMDGLYVSPMRRCLETAEILFPGQTFQVVKELAECDFGDFENKNYRELDGNADYQAWIDSGGTLPFPRGERVEDFKARTRRGFEKVVHACVKENLFKVGLVVHGGSVMSIMEAFSESPRPYYDWHVKNGGGFIVELDPVLWENGGRCLALLEEF